MQVAPSRLDGECRAQALDIQYCRAPARIISASVSTAVLLDQPVGEKSICHDDMAMSQNLRIWACL